MAFRTLLNFIWSLMFDMIWYRYCKLQYLWVSALLHNSLQPWVWVHGCALARQVVLHLLSVCMPLGFFSVESSRTREKTKGLIHARPFHVELMKAARTWKKLARHILVWESDFYLRRSRKLMWYSCIYTSLCVANIPIFQIQGDLGGY